MVTGKTQTKRIKNATRRQVMFAKRKIALRKKSYELSVVCDAEVGIIWRRRGKLSPSMQKMLERYQKYSQESDIDNTTKEQDNQHLKREIANMEERIRILESTQRKMMGEDLASCSVKELNHLESQAERGLNHIRAQKTKVLVDEIEQLKRKCAEYVDGPVLTSPVLQLGNIQRIEVETQLVMRPPNV